ncbi:MAG: C-GCAxxG-C-C family protein [Candidatus Odinarchaeota archaeon]
MNKIEKAVSFFNQGHNCAQAVLKAYGTQYGLDGDLAFKIASTLGGGIARSGNTCGAVTGALMALGLRYRNLNVEDKENKELTYETGMNFIEQFRSIYGTIKCKELLGYDISTLEGREKANNNNLFEELCPKFVKSAAEILETVLTMK